MLAKQLVAVAEVPDQRQVALVVGLMEVKRCA
jgi:hypothetical protein